MCVGGGKLSRAVYLAPTWVLHVCLTVLNAHSTCFKLSVHEVVSFIIIIKGGCACLTEVKGSFCLTLPIFPVN